MVFTGGGGKAAIMTSCQLIVLEVELSEKVLRIAKEMTGKSAGQTRTKNAIVVLTFFCVVSDLRAS
jgi:hypothetical protein